MPSVDKFSTIQFSGKILVSGLSVKASVKSSSTILDSILKSNTTFFQTALLKDRPIRNVMINIPIPQSHIVTRIIPYAALLDSSESLSINNIIISVSITIRTMNKGTIRQFADNLLHVAFISHVSLVKVSKS